MIEIKDLLLRFNNLLIGESFKKESIFKAISEVVGVHISLKDIKIKNNIIYLNIKPVYKNEIFLKKDLINLKLKELLGKNAPNQIR